MNSLYTYFNKTSHAAPLAVFRIIFGLMMLLSIVRFSVLGWIDKLYIQPEFFFSYFGFEFVKPFGAETYIIFILCGLSAFFVCIGFKYRVSIITFFLSFTYIELMDKTTYLNHYYFISLMSFVLIFLPAGKYFSWDSFKNSSKNFQYVPAWSIDVIKLMLAIVYFYAGLAKLNSEWLIEAMPLKIWLPTTNDLPLIGSMFEYEWVIYAFSWFGAFYDLSIPFLLFWKRTRILAFTLVLTFHVMTALLFPIGMFPYIMILSTLIFFSVEFHKSIISKVSTWMSIGSEWISNQRVYRIEKQSSRLALAVLLVIFFTLQFSLPFRHILYPNELFWTEEGYRFSWRVMLMEKAGYAQFKVVNHETGKWFYVDNTDFLSAFQEKQMSTQPDFILEYAHFLQEHFSYQGQGNIAIYVDSFVALNGRPSKRYIDPTVDLTQIKESFDHKTWILPFNEEISGI